MKSSVCSELKRSLIISTPLVTFEMARGYCQKDYFRKENLLINPKSLHFRLKEVGQCQLDPDSTQKNRMAGYKAACKAFIDLLKEVEGEDVMKRLSIPLNNLFIKMLTGSDERLIVFHPVLLRLQGTAAFLMRIYYLVNKTGVVHSQRIC